MVLSTRIPRLSLALVAAALATGCLHFSNMESCQPAPGETECWVSSGLGRHSGNEYVVVERVTPGDACDKVEIESSIYDPTSTLIERVVEVRRCGVTDQRSEYKYDLARGVIATRVELDVDHDDQIDVSRSFDQPMSSTDRALLVRAAPPRLAARPGGSAHN